ncbi:MAG: LamG-like jellyroll fold domain-containing protein [Ignavibacteriaceae bacterium]
MKFKLLFILIQILFISKIDAQWSSDPFVNNPICIGEGYQYNSKIISDGNGGAIIAWQDDQTGIVKIFTQRIDKYGYTKWLTNGIPLCENEGDQSEFDMVEDGSGGVIFAWQDNRDTINQIFVQRIDSSGNYKWNNNGIHMCSTEYQQTLPKIVYDAQGRFIVTWFDKRPGVYHIAAQKINPDGTNFWNENGISATRSTTSLKSYGIKCDGWGGIYIICEDSIFSSNAVIKAQYLTGAQNLIWGLPGSDLFVSNGLNTAQTPDFTITTEDKIVVTWADNRNGVFNTFAQSINRNGTTNFEPSGIPVSYNLIDQFNPQIVKSKNGSSIIVWEDYRDYAVAVPPKVFTQKISSIGLKEWAPDDIQVQLSSMDQWGPKILEDGFGGAHILWTDFSSEFGDIYAQSINSDGEFIKSWGTIITQAEWTQGLAGVTTDGSNGVIAVWSDRRNNLISNDIYCAQIDANGILGVGQGGKGLIADYTFNGNANDKSHFNNNGTVINATLTTDRFGNSQSAYQFDGTAYISIPASSSLSSPKTELTQCAWVQITQWGWFGDTYVPVITKSDVSDYTFQYRLAVSQDYLITSINNWDNSAIAQFNAVLNTWYFIASVLKDDTVKSYVNGNLINTYPIIPGPINYDTKPLEIGRDMPGVEEDFFGKIDDVKIYNRALTDEEIFNLYEYGNTTSILNYQNAVPIVFELSQNYPNPFNPSTKIKWQTPVAGHQTLNIYDVLGNEIATLVDEYKNAGSYAIDFNASQLSSGMYLYRLQVGEFTSTKKMILIR